MLFHYGQFYFVRDQDDDEATFSCFPLAFSAYVAKNTARAHL